MSQKKQTQRDLHGRRIEDSFLFFPLSCRWSKLPLPVAIGSLNALFFYIVFSYVGILHVPT